MRLPCRPTLRFLYHYIWKQGFRDGHRGLVLCRLLAWYERMIILKERDLTVGKSEIRGSEMGGQ
jgi:hypothetical protein